MIDSPHCETSSPGLLRQIRVVVVDDCARFRSTLARFLQRSSSLLVVGEAENAEEAIELAERLAPNLLITDLFMPGMNGMELCRLVRQRFPDIRCIVLSVENSAKWSRCSIEHGAAGFVTKQRLSEDLPAILAGVFPGTVSDSIRPHTT